ncbi:MAG: 2-octaprenyl-6-methoxyphenyl hydroxylase [Candidatus Pelagadaptatus aseana]|uniref:2-octaprenyl-6-methoxyphenyl hydroxylase n=1 Tax=Candidatus Pelagadaptatus aseana TaxID=3120508 RepID=UPI0039B2575A
MTEIQSQADITIVGGGMVGAAMAALLAHANAGWQVVLVEGFPLPGPGEAIHQPSFDDRSTALAYGSIELLQRIGVWDQLSQAATPIQQVHVSDRGHFGGSLIDASAMGLEQVGAVVANAWLGRVLLQHLHELDNVELLAPATVERVTPLAQGAHIDYASADASGRIESQLVVIADGADSPLRAGLGIGVDTQTYHQTAIIANVALNERHDCVAYERFTDQGPMALLPLGGENGCDSALVWTQPTDQVDALLALDDDAFMAQLQQRFGFRLGHFKSVGKRDSYPLQLLVAKEQVRSSLVMMGNAAHFLHPVAGQGFNLALRDCAALTSVLARARRQRQPLGSLQVLQQYEQQQQLDQQATIQFSDKLTRLFSTGALPSAGLRALGFLGLETLPGAKQLLASQTMGQASRRPVFHR